MFHHDHFEFNDGARPPLDYDLEARIRYYSTIDKVVYLERDPRDVMVSLYFQVTGRFKDYFNYQGNISDFIRDDYFGAQNLHHFRTMWDAITERCGFLKITYEGCHQDLRAVFHSLLDYYEFKVDDNLVENALQNSSFVNMKQVEQEEIFAHAWLRPRQGAPKVRMGMVGGYLRELREDDIRYLDEIFWPHSPKASNLSS